MGTFTYVTYLKETVEGNDLFVPMRYRYPPSSLYYFDQKVAKIGPSFSRQDGTPTKRRVSKRQVSKRPVSKRLKTSGLQNVRFSKRQVYKMSGLQNVRSSKRPVAKKHPYIFCTCGWWKSAGSVAAMFAGKVMAVFYSLF
jgi:hypothetical protein